MPAAALNLTKYPKCCQQTVCDLPIKLRGEELVLNNVAPTGTSLAEQC